MSAGENASGFPQGWSVAPEELFVAQIAAMTPERDTRSRMMAAADTALYRAKSQGRNQVCIQD